MSVKNSSDTIGNRTRDLPACSALPKPSASPLASGSVAVAAAAAGGGSTSSISS